MVKRRQVTAQIVGGLGNQLFGLSAGMYLSKKLNVPLKLDLSMIGKGGTDHGKSIMNFEFPENILLKPIKMRTHSYEFVKRINNKLSRTFKGLSQFQNNVMHIYSSSELGFEEKFVKISEPKYIKGYFQSHIYADENRETLIKIINTTPTSDWFNETLSELNEINPYVLHVRRGDYKNLTEEFGLLSIEYYKNAVFSWNEYQVMDPVWIFTDSPAELISEVKGTIFSHAKIINPPPSATVNESLLLMSKARYLAIGNSTFSWWAGYLNVNQSNIVAPSKWFKGREDPDKLIPPHWSLAESIWK